MIELILIIGGVVALVGIWLIVTYNSLVTSRNQVDEGWSDIDVQLKRRHDLIPNLVSTVKGYVSHEKGVLEGVTEARTRAISSHDPKEQIQAENQLSGALKTLFAVSENYPVLKANQNFSKLQDELSDTENKIQAARRFYNGQVRDLNIKLESFPTNLIASSFGFTKRELFDLDEEPQARENVKVAF